MNPTITLNVDLSNPGQFFACCGLFELASRIAPDALAWSDAKAPLFHLANTPTLAELLGLVCCAELRQLDAEDATASALELGSPFDLRLDWWKTAGRDTSALKVWAGTMACPRIARAMSHAVRNALSDTFYASADIFADRRVVYDPDDANKKVEPFYFDARRGPNAHSRDVGFAPDSLSMRTNTSPAVELLCLIGLQRAIPTPVHSKPRHYMYCSWSIPLLIALLPAAVNGLLPDVSPCKYCFESWFRTGQRKHKAFVPAERVIG